MGRKGWLGFGAVALVVGTAIGLMFQAHTRLVSAAQIEAALPDSLRGEDVPDPQARARYARFRQIVDGFRSESEYDWAVPFSRMATLLAEGPLQAPPLASGAAPASLVPEGRFAAALRTDGRIALRQHDRDRAQRDAALGLRFTRAMVDSSRTLFEGLFAMTTDGLAVHEVAYLDEWGGFDAAGRKALLALLPMEDGTLPAMEGVVRREFRTFVVPALLDPDGTLRKSPSVGGAAAGLESAGSFEGLETAQLMAKVYGTTVENAGRSFARRSDLPERLVREAGEGLPDLREVAIRPGMAQTLARLKYRILMNAQHNGIGRRLVRESPVILLPQAIARWSAQRNLTRAALLLRMGRPARLPDPFSTGTLRIDPKRRIVWSVGYDGKDDGGKIDPPESYLARDLGLHY